jgi:hypothetical protein
MTAFHMNPVARASRRAALVLATVAFSWGPLGGVAQAKGWGAHQAQVAPPMHARPALSGPVLAHPMMAPHLALSSSLRRMAAEPMRIHDVSLMHLGGGGAPREPLRINASMRPLALRAHLATHPSAARSVRPGVRWPVAAGTHPLPAGTLGPNAPLARVVREGRVPVLEALRRQASRR